MTTLEAIRYSRGKLELLDQKRLPHEFIHESVQTAEEGWDAIRQMKVRGAPAIAIAAALSLAVEAFRRRDEFKSAPDAYGFLNAKLDYLKTSRPTAVNLFEAIGRLKKVIEVAAQEFLIAENSGTKVIDAYIEASEKIFADDVIDNKAIGAFGAECFFKTGPGPFQILTHCNTGSLATASYGTALGVIRALHDKNLLAHAFATETRPYNQGARLTAFELVYEKIPATLITDSMASFLMAKNKIHGVVVGADRVVKNGDTANKIGTYQLAIAAKYHNIPFYVAAPCTSIDLSLTDGSQIHIEERPREELTHVAGFEIAAPGINVWNPSFDITPGSLITGIITEVGVVENDNGFDLENFLGKHGKFRT